jgi:hypothetical protein
MPGEARVCGLFGIMDANKEVHMDLNHLTDDERLIAERAVLMARAVKMAGDNAPHGRGLACLEQAVMEQGMDLLRLTLEKTIGARDEAQKKG